MRLGRLALACAALAGAACGGRSDGQAPPRPGDAAAVEAAPADVPERPLGLPEHAAFQWRRRGGHPAYQMARKAEAAGQWEVVVKTCRQALTADPSHLEAAWLLAAGLGRLGKLDELLEPLHLAVAGDFAKWGQASLDNPAFAAFLDTPAGKAWARRVEQDRAAYTAALARSLIVTAGGELFAYDPKGPRWHRLTHTYGAVIGGLPVPSEKRLVYVTRQRARGKREITLAVGVVDLGRGRTIGATELGTKGPITVASSAKESPGVWIGTRGVRGASWQVLDDVGKLTPLPPRTLRPPGAWLDVVGKTVRPRTLPVRDITADFDDKGLASAIRIGRSNRILSVPSPGLIDGNSLAWSPDGAQLAFVAQLDDECGQGAPNAAAYVADATTGALRELERAAGGLGVDWLSDGRPVVAGDKGVSTVDASGGPLVIEGAEGLLAPRVRPKCSPTDDDAPPPEDPEGADAAGAAGDAAPAPAPSPPPPPAPPTPPVAAPPGARPPPAPAPPTPPVAAPPGARPPTPPASPTPPVATPPGARPPASPTPPVAAPPGARPPASPTPPVAAPPGARPPASPTAPAGARPPTSPATAPSAVSPPASTPAPGAGSGAPKK